jgi:4-hydroxy-tetrahydrodipicolinate synthase
VVNAAGDDAAVICGLKCKDTLGTIRDAKKAQDLGAVGLQINLPIFHHPTQDDYVRFFTDISDAIDIGIMIYNTHWFGAESITADTMLRLKDAEHVVAVKWAVTEGQDYANMRRFSDIFNVIDNSSQPTRCHKNGGAGYIDPMMAVYPAHPLAVWGLCEAEKYDEAQQLFESVKVPFRDFMARAAERSGGYRAMKGLMAVMGRPVGPPRPPTLPLDEEEMAELRDIVAEIGWPLPERS